MRDVVLVTVECLRSDYATTLAPKLGERHDCYTAGHYTRPALAGLLSGNTTAAAQAQCRLPTIATVLRDAGYSTIVVTHSPQTTRGLHFHDGFQQVHHDTEGDDGRGSYWREWLGQYRPVRAVHRRVRPKAATLSAIPDDETAVSQAVGAYESAAPPRFLWVHLMGSHRPYGRGDDRLPASLSRRAAAATPGRLTPTLNPEAADRVRQHYRQGIDRTGGRVRRLVDAVSDDAAVVVVGDHGEELGEDSYWFHAPYRRRTVDSVTRTALWTRGVPVGDSLVRQVDIPPALAAVAGVQSPWPGTGLGEARHAVTVAPWAETTNVAYRTAGETLRFTDATAEAIEHGAVDAKTESRLQALGYV